MKREALLISNPAAGPQRGDRGVAILAEKLKASGVQVQVLETNGPGDASRLAESAARNGITDVIIAGGDGTINEALQGLIGADLRLGIWSRGTANVLACELGWPREASEAAGVIVRGNTRYVHAGCATEENTGLKRYFLLMAGIGLDASIVRGVRPRLKQRLGKGAFWLSGFEHLARRELDPFVVEVDGESFEATFALIGKAASYGGGLAVTPRAEIEKPDFEILLANCQSRMRLLQLVSRNMRRREPLRGPEIAFRRAAVARALGNAPVQVDGELIGELPMRFEIAPWRVQLIVP